MSFQEDSAKFLGPGASVADRIRALAAAGHSRAEIARMLGKRYQHVRNVLEADAAKVAAEGHESRASESGPTGDGTIHRLAVDHEGRISLPAGVEKALGLRRGGVVIAEMNGDRLVLISSGAALRRAQEFVRSLPIPEGVSLAEELIADRRREAEREAQDD